MSERLNIYLEKNLDEIKNRLTIDAIAIYQSDSKQKQLHLISFCGEKPRDTAAYGEDAIGQCAQSIRSFTIEVDHSTRPDKYQSKIYLPIKSGEVLWGVFVGASTQKGHFSKRETQYLVKALIDKLSSLTQSE